MKQSDIVKLLRKEFGHHEVTVFTASQKNKSGILDCEIAYKGQGFWIEIKILPDTLKRKQEIFIERHSKRAFLLSYNPKEEIYYFRHYDNDYNFHATGINTKQDPGSAEVLFLKRERLLEIKKFFNQIAIY